MQRLITILLFCILYITGFAQPLNPVFNHITRSSGLPVDEVVCLAQDSTGFMWMGTKEGLFRYDGFSFKGFYSKPGDPSTLPGNYILKIYTDSKGLLWILVNRSGLTLMNSEGKVLQLVNSATNPSFPGLDHVYDIKEDNMGFYWCSTSEGLYKLKNDKGIVNVIKRIDLTRYHYGNNNLGTFVIDKSGKIWICTLTGLVIYDPGKDVLYHAKNNPSQLPVLNNTETFAHIFLDEKKGKLWYATWAPATRVCDLKTGTISSVYSVKGKAFPDFGQVVNRFFYDSQTNLWMATGNGISLFRNTSRQFFQHLDKNPFSLIGNIVNDICEDREGNFWIATVDGISITRPYRQSFINLSANSIGEYAFAGKKVNAIVTADSNSLLISAQGLYETDLNFRVKQHFSFGTMDDWIWKYYKDEEGKQIYISTQTGVLLYNIKTHSVKKVFSPPFNENLPVSSFVKLKDENIWMSRYRDVFFKYNLRKKTYKKYSLTALGEKPSILLLFSDKAQNLWILSQETGLLRFDEKTGTFIEKIISKPGKTDGLLQPNILCMLDIGKYYFIGYVTKGFSLYNKTTKTFLHFSHADGLASNSVTDATEKNGMIWITTLNGISQFNTTTKEFIKYNHDNGILDNSFETIAQLPDGRIAAGSMKGLVLFHPDSINVNRDLPPPIISDLAIYGRKISADSLVVNRRPLSISYKENYFSISYISLLYHNNQQIEYAYRLEGLDKNWISAETRRNVNYSNLNGGNYHFKVRARLPGGMWVESKYPFPIIVTAAFYTQWWFYVLIAFVFVLIVYSIYRYRVQQIIRLEKMRTSISGDLHDEVGATLSSISIFSEMAKQSVQASSKAEIYLQRIGERSRESIEKMSDIIWSINPENDRLDQMLTRMKNYANEILEAKNISVHWLESENLSLLKLSMLKRKNLYLLFKEVINNAAKYSAANNVYIKLNANHKHIQLSVIDDGVGFDINNIQPGNGLKNIQRRSQLLNGKVVIESKGAGCSLQLFFPF